MKDEKGIPMPEPNGFTSAIEGENEASEQPGSKSAVEGLSRRTFLDGRFRESSERGTGFPGCQCPGES
jgi:hypothetical protein